jgi:hypothetical protein
MDSFEIVNAVMNGATLEIYSQQAKDDVACAYVDEKPVSVSQAVRASQNPLVKISAKSGNWAAYSA